MKLYKVVIAYDGTQYKGWQVQKDRPTIAQRLQNSFFEVFGESISIRGISRTDAGVHALGQVAVFRSALTISPATMQWAWCNHLPEDITIRSLEQASLDFNPYKGINQKTYIYHFFTERPLPFIARYGWFLRKKVNIAVLQHALQVFVGTHDFRSFSTGDDRGDDTVRTIDSIQVRYMSRYNAYAIIIKGPKFLRYMIRRIVGACMTVAVREDLSCNDLLTILAQKNPNHTLPNAPAKGLVLYKICYTSAHNVPNVTINKEIRFYDETLQTS